MRRQLLFPTLALCAGPLAGSFALAQEATPVETAVVRGIVVDSVNGGLLPGALIRVQGTSLESLTNEFGEFRIADVPPGTYRMLLLHPVVDTLGITLMTPAVTLRPGENRIVDIAIPSGETLAQVFCPPARRLLGPAVLAGVVRDPDTGESVAGARVSLLYYESDQLGLTRLARVREATTDSTGRYRVCGLPTDMSGKVQVFHGGISSGEVNVEVKDGFVALRSLSIAPRAPVVVAGVDTAAAPVAPAPVRAEARVTGRVVDRLGRPIAGARVGVQGTTAATLTRDDGSFTLDSLPSGTQALDVRKIGFSPADAAVELSVLSVATVTVSMSEHVPTLEPVRVEAARERALLDVGYFQRKRSGIGRYLDGDEINRNAIQLSDALRQVPNIRVVPAGPGRNVLTSARDPNGGCVALYIDGTLWRQMSPGDVDSFVRPDEIEAIESYTATNVPPQFSNVGASRCDTVVIWTSRRINRGR